MRLFEGGIYSKMTEDEYQKLRQNQDGNTENRIVSEGANDQEEGHAHLKATSMKTLQGAFYVLIIGYILSSKSHFTCTVFSNGTVHPARFLVPFMRFVDGSKMGQHIFDPSNCLTTGPCV